MKPKGDQLPLFDFLDDESRVEVRGRFDADDDFKDDLPWEDDQ